MTAKTYPEKLYYYPDSKSVGLLPDMGGQHVEYSPKTVQTCAMSLGGNETCPNIARPAENYCDTCWEGVTNGS